MFLISLMNVNAKYLLIEFNVMFVLKHACAQQLLILGLVI